jgi:hypothetical protein
MSEIPMKEAECVKLNKDGKPFGSEGSAMQALQNLGMVGDVWGVYRYDGGYAMMKHQFYARKRDEAEEAAKARDKAAKTAPMTYRKIRLAGRGSPNDWPKGWANVNGQFPAGLEIERGKTVVLPDSIVSVLRDAHVPVFMRPKDRPEVPMVEGEPVYTFPFDDFGPATKEEFDEFMQRGRVATVATIEKHRREHSG